MKISFQSSTLGVCAVLVESMELPALQSIVQEAMRWAPSSDGETIKKSLGNHRDHWSRVLGRCIIDGLAEALGYQSNELLSRWLEPLSLRLLDDAFQNRGKDVFPGCLGSRDEDNAIRAQIPHLYGGQGWRQPLFREEGYENDFGLSRRGFLSFLASTLDDLGLGEPSSWHRVEAAFHVLFLLRCTSADDLRTVRVINLI